MQVRTFLFCSFLAGLVLTSAAADWPDGKARQALFLQLGGRVVVYRLQPGMVRTEPLIQFFGNHYETRIVYCYNRPVFQSVLVPDYQKIGEKLFLHTVSGDKEFTNVHWQTVNIIDDDGYPRLHARTDIENALENFGLKFSDRKETIIRALLDGAGLTPEGESYTPVADVATL